ncbi:hypothetical protein BT96DRAFT_927634 [Gymnopus androsaceus JB14]|uniref:ABM domain-containing protein n=1 Tax=Gymnopus androsaceus JB14 TaxID=1447944 RepID=A0A6A4GQ24_9AGAR|nr:hypothetical protein BT96DRAFT_927634 [Gymnopus androsaceus JB14]
MKPITLEYLAIKVEKGFSLAAPAFASLRQTVVELGGVKEQYYGFTDDQNESTAMDHSYHFQPTSWLVPFRFAEEVRPALAAPVCEFAFIALKETSKPSSISESLHKTFTDCYYAKGFTGGNWGIASNSDNRMCVYVLGWESRADHAAYSKSALFDVEINKLLPHYAPGSMGLFSKLTQEKS